MKLIAFAIMSLVLLSSALMAAEVRGTVSIDYQGLFGDVGAGHTHRISVAVLPADGQRTAPREKRKKRIEIINNRMTPAFLTVQKGDAIQFINRDNVYHELFSLTSGEPVKARLGKADEHLDNHAEFNLKQAGTIHFFCRIHNKSYARIDVVDTPYLQMVEPGGGFRFVGLSPGLWRLRLAAPAAETKWVDVVAMTTPPPLHLTLMSHGGSGAGKNPGADMDAGQLYQRAGNAGKNR